MKHKGSYAKAALLFKELADDNNSDNENSNSENSLCVVEGQLMADMIRVAAILTMRVVKDTGAIISDVIVHGLLVY